MNALGPVRRPIDIPPLSRIYGRQLQFVPVDDARPDFSRRHAERFALGGCRLQNLGVLDRVRQQIAGGRGSPHWLCRAPNDLILGGAEMWKQHERARERRGSHEFHRRTLPSLGLNRQTVVTSGFRIFGTIGARHSLRSVSGSAVTRRRPMQSPLHYKLPKLRSQGSEMSFSYFAQSVSIAPDPWPLTPIPCSACLDSLLA